MASTINGYEGTGRSLSLKLIQQLRESTRPSLTKDAAPTEDDATAPSSSKKPIAKAAPKARTLREIKLETPIRYATNDKVEKWLNSLLCLDATVLPRQTHMSCPHPSKCELFYVSRDTLFSYHPASEVFLQRMMALYVASHYKNQPNDLQLLSDAPAHHLFVLLPPLAADETHLPEPLVVLQVALEGSIAREAILDGLSRGFRAGGDMIPWLVAQQFQEGRFASLSGARVVRIATHPDYANMGYGGRALQALNAYYSGEYFDVAEAARAEEVYPDAANFEEVRASVGRMSKCGVGADDVRVFLVRTRHSSRTSRKCARRRPCRRCSNALRSGSRRRLTISGYHMDSRRSCSGTSEQRRSGTDGRNSLRRLWQVLEARGLRPAVPAPDAERAHRRAHVRHGPRPAVVDRGRASVAEGVRKG